QEQWPKTVEDMMRNNRGLSPEEVFSALADRVANWDGLDPATKVGHVHLHVSRLAPTEHFYHDVLGFDIPFDLPGAQAMFFSAGGYHHHIGTNLWQGEGAPPPPADAIGLRYFTVVLPDEAERQRVAARVQNAGIATEPVDEGILLRDPAANAVLLSADQMQPG
ncbi:MAG: VOC family protein, partial [Anaerolineae bacterium]|nr:VOC family protein [Anaerolineae bacterium]